jgi:hypothetical protein
MQDYVPDSSQTTGFQEISGYRVLVAAKDALGNPYFDQSNPPNGATITIWATDQATIYFMDGTSATIDEQTSCSRATDSQGELTFVIDAQSQLICPMLKVSASFMAAEERLVISPDRHVHATLASLTGAQLTGQQALPSGKTQALISGGNYTAADINAAAQAISNVMSTAIDHNVQPERPLTRTRDLPEHFPLAVPYIPIWRAHQEVDSHPDSA